MKKAMRDVLLEKIYEKMKVNNNIYFVSADFGSPVLDKVKAEFKERFINVGIAEQNLINVTSGLAYENAIVFAYAIAPFISMRAYEQLRNNLSILSSKKNLNVNLISVGAGVSYDLSGPSHHCLEDLSIIRVLPDFSVYSISDYKMSENIVDILISNNNPKYVRLDGKPVEKLYENTEFDFETGFNEIKKGNDLFIIATGYMVHKALKIAENLKTKGINAGVIDVFKLKPFNYQNFSKTLKKYKNIISIEEGFINVGGLDSIVYKTLVDFDLDVNFKNFGFDDKYAFQLGARENIYEENNLGDEQIVEFITKWK